MKKSNRGITGVEEVIALVVILALVGAFFGMNIKIPFVKTKVDVQRELVTEQAAHKLTQAELISASKLTADQKTLLEDLKAGAQRQAVLDQSASNAVARITATFAIAPAVNRKETVIDYAAQEAAKALPVPVNYPEILQKTRDQLDEAKTSNAALLAQHTSDLNLIDTQKQALALAQKAIADQQAKVDAQQAANDAQKKANDEQRKALDAQGSILSATLAGLDRLKMGLMGLVGLGGIICIGAGFFLKNAILSAKGVVLDILAVAGMWIPIMWYLGAIGLVLLAGGAYIISQWHREKSIADNAIGILQETKQKAPEFWNTTIRPISTQYWGTGVKDVAKAQKWVTQKLYDMNMLPKDQKP
jgi:hypothetical protein